MEHLLSAWSEVLEQLRQARHILLLCDYDGTLAPIVEQPELASIPEKTRLLLQALAHQRLFTLGIISGRALADLKERINLNNVVYAGNHGFEIEGPGWSFINPLAEEIRPFFRVIFRWLTLAFETTKGVLVEDKGFSLSVHYRQVADANAADMKNIFKSIVDDARAIKDFRVTLGKKVFELRPAVDWDKGKAIDLLIEKYGGNRKDILPIFLGDDVTDEDGFREIGKLQQGITVHVGNDPCRTTAKYYLNSTDEVGEFFNILLGCSRTHFE